MITLAVDNLKLDYASVPALDGVDFAIARGEMVALLGANGAGKSTLLRCISRVLEPGEGSIILEGKDSRRFKINELARTMAVVPQENTTDFDFTVEEVVLMGRLPYLNRFQKEGEEDRVIAREALAMTGVAHLAGRSVATLSGGERQRVIMARAICQQPRLLLLDEPTANLDLRYQSVLLDLALRLNQSRNVTVIAAIHDLNLAACFFKRFIMLAGGRVLAAGNPEEVITPGHIRQSYGVSAAVFRHPLNGRIQVSVPGVRSAQASPKKARVHVVGGGEAALPCLELLREKGYSLSLGPVTAEDSGCRYARYFGIPYIEVAPFSPIPAAAHEAHLAALREAAWVVLPPVPFSRGNLCNLEAVEQVLETGARVVMVEEAGGLERDYCVGKAAEILERLAQKGALRVGGASAIPGCMEKEGEEAESEKRPEE